MAYTFLICQIIFHVILVIVYQVWDNPTTEKSVKKMLGNKFRLNKSFSDKLYWIKTFTYIFQERRSIFAGIIERNGLLNSHITRDSVTQTPSLSRIIIINSAVEEEFTKGTLLKHLFIDAASICNSNAQRITSNLKRFLLESCQKHFF